MCVCVCVGGEGEGEGEGEFNQRPHNILQIAAH